MTEEELNRLGEKRRLIFSNIANGVPVENVMAAFYCSRLEVEQVVAFVGRKIKEYRFRHCTAASKFAAPPVFCETIGSALQNRRAAMETLSKLGPKYLASELLLPKLKIHTVDEKDVQEISARMRGKR